MNHIKYVTQTSNTLDYDEEVVVHINSDLLTNLSFIVGILGLAVAVWQTFSARNARKLYI